MSGPHPELGAPEGKVSGLLSRWRAGCATGILQRTRRLLADRPMRADVVVVVAPSLQLFAGVGKGQEPVRVHALGPNAAVECLGEGVVGGLARSGEVECDTLGVGPQVEIAGDELGPLVDPDRLRIADRGTDLFEGSNHVLAAIRDAGVEGR